MSQIFKQKIKYIVTDNQFHPLVMQKLWKHFIVLKACWKMVVYNVTQNTWIITFCGKVLFSLCWYETSLIEAIQEKFKCKKFTSLRQNDLPWRFDLLNKISLFSFNVSKINGTYPHTQFHPPTHKNVNITWAGLCF